MFRQICKTGRAETGNKMSGRFETDASEVEDLNDSTGADGLPDRLTSRVVNSDLLSALGQECELTDKATKDIHITPHAEETRHPEQFSANGRADLRKQFAKAPPIILPTGHATVSVNETQIHAVLKTLRCPQISDETVKSWFHVML